MIYRALLALLLAISSFVLASTAQAHFKLNLNVRIFHIVHDDTGFDLLLRMPMAYLVADKIGPEGADGLPAPAPYTWNRLEDDAPMHLVDAAALRMNPEGLGLLAADALEIKVDGEALTAEVLSVQVHSIGREPGFATRAEAETVLASQQVIADSLNETYVGDAIVDIRLRFDGARPVNAFSLRMTADPGLPGQESTANLILNHATTETRTYRATGLLGEPVEISGSVIAATSTFVIEGVRHILEGLDHVLFVLCMIIGAVSLRSLIGRVTGFTVGHTVTLILGFFGFAPQGAWFIPAVESAIALSIIFAAVDAVIRGRTAGANPDRYGMIVTTAIGLLHGFGFSFMLQNILRVDAPNVWQSLLAFNIGVELGQLAIVAAIWPIVLYLRSRPAIVWRTTTIAVAAVATVISAIWFVERAGGILA